MGLVLNQSLLSGCKQTPCPPPCQPEKCDTGQKINAPTEKKSSVICNQQTPTEESPKVVRTKPEIIKIESKVFEPAKLFPEENPKSHCPTPTSLASKYPRQPPKQSQKKKWIPIKICKNVLFRP